LLANYVKFVWQNKYSLLSYHYITADKTQTQHHLQTWLCDKTITNYIFSYLIMWLENYALYLYYLTDFVCLYNYKFLLSLCKIARSSVILLLPLPDYVTRQLQTISVLPDYVTRQWRTIFFLLDYVRRQLRTIFVLPDYVTRQSWTIFFLPDYVTSQLRTIFSLPDYMTRQ
jgi:hypothetical protein